MLKRILALLLCLLALKIPIKASAVYMAKELTSGCKITADGADASFLTDNNIYTYRSVNEVRIESSSGLYGLYIKFDRTPAEWTLIANGVEIKCGKGGFLHEYIELYGESELVLSFDAKVSIADVFLYSAGMLPESVQRWETLERADIMICPTHSDDDQLYFAGMIPWCTAMGYRVQVVYLTNHLNTHDRPHELLDGLWHCGLKYYPVISEYPDLYATSSAEAEATFGSIGVTKEDFEEFYVELFNRYKPLAVAGHDINGEYGHGVHMLNSAAIMKAVELSAERGLWDVPKTYIHSWKENPVVFNWDTPMEELDGKTPFEVSQEGYGFHHSQHRFESLSRWLYGTEGAPITKAAQIGSHSPCRYGLYRSTVGMDTVENGIFQNLESFKEQPVTEEYTPHAIFSAEEAKNRYKKFAESSLSIKKPVAIVKAKTEELTSETSREDITLPVEKSKKYGWIYIIGAAVVALGATAVLIKKRKNK